MRQLDLFEARDSFNAVWNINVVTVLLGATLGFAHLSGSSSWSDGYHWGRSPAGVHGCSRAKMNSAGRQGDNLAAWVRGCEAGVDDANVAALHPGSSVSGHCVDVLYSQPPKGAGRLRSVALKIDKRDVTVRFFASIPWNMSSVARGDGNIQWSFTEWVPHHRPIIEDNHGGTLFPAGGQISRTSPSPSPYVYFRHLNQIAAGRYSFSPMMVELVYRVASLRALGMRTPFTWVGSLGLQRCAGVTER